MAYYPMFWGGGLSCLEPTPWSVMGVSPRWGRQAGVGTVELSPSGGKTVARQGEAGRPTTRARPSQKRKRRHYEHEARGTAPPAHPDPPPFEEEQRNHPGRHHLPDRVMFRRCGDARFRSGYLGSVGDAGGTVTPRNSPATKH